MVKITHISHNKVKITITETSPSKRAELCYIVKKIARGCAYKQITPFSWLIHISLIPVLKQKLDKISYNKRTIEKKALQQFQNFFSTQKTQIDFNIETKYPLRQFQKEGVSFVNKRRVALLADEQGLGKTFQLIYDAILLSKDIKDFRALFVVPSNVKYKWEREFFKFFHLPRSEVRVIDASEIGTRLVNCGKEPGNWFFVKKSDTCKNCELYRYCLKQHKKKWKEKTKNVDSYVNLRKELYLGPEPFKITNYALLRNDYKWLRTISPFHLLSFDEVHRLKTTETEQSIACREMIKTAQFVRAASGTPMQGKLMHMFNVFNALEPGFFGSEKDYTDKFFSYTTVGTKRLSSAINYTKVIPKNVQEIKLRLPYLMIRRLKKDVAPEIPDKIPDQKFILLNNQERSIYNKIEQGTLNLNHSHILRENQINDMQMSLYGPRIFLELCVNSLELISDQYRNFKSSKMRALEEDIEKFCDEENQKVVVFTKSAKMIRIFAREYKKYSPLSLTGGLGSRGKQEVTEQFLQQEQHRILFMNTAGKEGIDLHGYDDNGVWRHGCNILIFFDMVWNQGDILQIMDRIHRIGQKENVLVPFYICHNTIEEAMLSQFEKHNGLFEELLNSTCEV